MGKRISDKFNVERIGIKRINKVDDTNCKIKKCILYIIEGVDINLQKPIKKYWVGQKLITDFCIRWCLVFVNKKYCCKACFQKIHKKLIFFN